MARGRPRKKFDPSIPKHIDQSQIPNGIYWNNTGSGRWYVRDPHPEGIGYKTTTVAQATARLSELHAIAERRAGKDARGTIGFVIEKFEASTDFAALAPITQKDYRGYAKGIRSYKTKLGCTLDKLRVDEIRLPLIQRLIESIAKGTPESRPGAGDGIPPYPTKANHWLRYLRRLFRWGMRHGHCNTNPAKGAAQVQERKRINMPTHEAYAIALRRAKEGASRKAHSLGSCPPYLWPIMEIMYLCRCRGTEVVVDMTDASATEAGLLISRRKGSNDNVTSWSPRLRAAWNAALAIRAEVYARPANRGKPIPIKPEHRYVFVNRSGDRLTKGAFDQAWQDFMSALVKEGALTPEQRFTPHGLKHRGITDTPGTKADKQLASGHKTPAMLDHYDHDLPLVLPADAPEEFG